MKTSKITQWEYARLLLPYDETMTEERLIGMSRGALFCWIDETKKKRDEARKYENAELTQEYDKLIEEQKDNLLSVAEGMTTLEKKGLNEWKGPCPICKQGHDRFSVNTRDVPFWYCRHCTDGGDTVALVAKVSGLTMWEAVEELAGYSPRDRAEVRARTYTKITPDTKPKQPLTDFTAKFDACQQLFYQNGLTAFAYFEHNRGLSRETALKNRVGLAQTHRGLAIAYPCERFDQEEEAWQITAYNRRYLDDVPEEARKKNPKTKLVKGGKWGLYRLRRIREAKVLMVIEGEENALSVWERARANEWSADVISVGSQGNFKSLQNDIMALCGDYQHLIIWADEKRIADEALDLYRHDSSLAIYSPQLADENKPLDANDLLKRGELDKVLYYHLRRLSAYLVGEYDYLLDASAELPTNAPQTDALDRADERALWAKYASEIEEEDDDLLLGSVIASAWWADLEAEVLEDGNEWAATMTASDELLCLCAALAEEAQDRERVLEMYLEAERRYMYEDATSLFEQYQKMANQDQNEREYHEKSSENG